MKMERVSKDILIFGAILCFLSGMLNAVTIIKLSTGITYLSGNFSKLAIKTGSGYLIEVDYIIEIILCFFIGSIISGVIIGKREFSLKKRYGLIVIAIGWIILSSHLILGNHKSFVLILSLVSGIQNGLFITYKGIVVRTTHVTGGITDLGVSIGNYIRKKSCEIWKIEFQFILLLGFFLGGVFGSFNCYYFNGDEYNILAFGYMVLGSSYFFWRRKYLKNNI
ncbi:MAG: DUF1275 domain-containing protein [Fusobacteria bacterium]|nr:MAG: DUF1275 domain-containing protein [Fusobacteriota bacterium]